MEKNYQKLGLKIEVRRDSNGHLNVNRAFVESDFRKISISSDEVREHLIGVYVDKIANIDDERNFYSEVAGGSDSITNSVFSLLIESLDRGKESRLEDIKEKEVKDLTITDINLLMTEKMNEKSVEFLEYINKRFCSYMDGNLQISWDFEDTLRSRINLETQFENNRGNRIDFMSTGSGTRSLYLLSLLESYVESATENNGKPGLFLIEEPELYLYPKLEKKMGKILKQISKNNQVIITSHSSGLVSQFNRENIYVVRIGEALCGSKSEFSKLKDSNELVELLGFNSHPILKAKYVFMVEGVGDINAYTQVASLHYPDKIKDCGFIEVNGLRNIEVAVTCKLIKDTEQIDNLFIITDADGRKQEKVKNRFREALKSAFEPKELEELLDNRVYITEKAMNLECLSFTYDNIDFEKEPNYDERLNDFIEKNWEDIERRMDHQNGRKDIYTEEEKLKMREVLTNGLAEEKLEVLRRHLLFKRLIKKYRNEVYIHPLISQKDKEYQKAQLGNLFEKLDRLFQQ